MKKHRSGGWGGGHNLELVAGGLRGNGTQGKTKGKLSAKTELLGTE